MSTNITTPSIQLTDDCLDFHELAKAVQLLPLMCSEALFDSSPNYQLKNLSDEERKDKNEQEQLEFATVKAGKIIEKPKQLPDPDSDATIDALRLWDARSKVVKVKTTEYYEKNTALKEVKRWLLNSLTTNNKEKWEEFPPGVIYEKMQERFETQSLKKRHVLQVEMSTLKMNTNDVVEFIDHLTSSFIKHATIRDLSYGDRERIQVLLAAVTANKQWKERGQGISRTIDNNPEWPSYDQVCQQLMGMALNAEEGKVQIFSRSSSWNAKDSGTKTKAFTDVTALQASPRPSSVSNKHCKICCDPSLGSEGFQGRKFVCKHKTSECFFNPMDGGKAPSQLRIVSGAWVGYSKRLAPLFESKGGFNDQLTDQRPSKRARFNNGGSGATVTTQYESEDDG
jgi:hypothetical protein